jgi:hypothetical protein
MLDLFAIAGANGAAVRTAFEALVAALAADRAGQVEHFARWVEKEALIAINVKLFVIVELLNGRGYQNSYDWAREQAHLSGRGIEEALRERLGEWYERRTTFDRSFRDGELFRYGALNAGGTGVDKLFDPFCVVLTRIFQGALMAVAYLPGDSLKICFGADGIFDDAAIQRRATPHTHRHLMVALERANEISGVDERRWPELVSSGLQYFEVVFVGEVSLDAVGCVRVSKGQFDRLWNLAFGNFGRKLGDAERALVQDFIDLRRAEIEGKIQIEVVG